MWWQISLNGQQFHKCFNVVVMLALPRIVMLQPQVVLNGAGGVIRAMVRDVVDTNELCAHVSSGTPPPSRLECSTPDVCSTLAVRAHQPPMSLSFRQDPMTQVTHTARVAGASLCWTPCPPIARHDGRAAGVPFPDSPRRST